MSKHVVDLFAGRGGFSQAFADSSRWEVTTVDIEESHNPDIQADILDLTPADLPDAELYVGSPPCTTLSIAGNQTDHFENGEPNSQLAKKHVALAYHTLGLIQAKSPEWWFLENPRGRLRRYLGKPPATVCLCQYGYNWQKPTDLWGEHPPSFDARQCPPGGECHANGPNGFDSDEETEHVRAPEQRSKLPEGLSAEILRSVENPEPEQRTFEQIIAQGGSGE